MVSNAAQNGSRALSNLANLDQLYSESDIIRIVEAAKKYDQPEGTPITHVPEYTTPGGPNTYVCTDVTWAWTQGFFPGLLWLVIERERLVPGTLAAVGYTEEEVVQLARKYQASFRHVARHPNNHDQGFRFQIPYGRDLELTGNKEVVEVLIEAADSLVDRYSPEVGCIRSWNSMKKVGYPNKYRLDNQDEHFLVIIDNMMNLDLLFEATDLTGDKKYADIAILQAKKMMDGHVRSNGTTYHVVNFGQDGSILEQMTSQGYSDESCWTRGQGWGIYGYAQIAKRTGNQDFLNTSRKLADAFLSRLPESGVPWWDFDAPTPCPYDSSAATVAARGMMRLYELLLPTDPSAAEHYLKAGCKLIEDTLRECANPPASKKDDSVNWGEGGWETILAHGTINANEHAVQNIIDIGIVYGDYYLVEFANEALKLRQNATS